MKHVKREMRAQLAALVLLHETLSLLNSVS